MKIRKSGFRGKGRMGNPMMGTQESPGALSGRIMNAAPSNNPAGPLSPAPKLPGTGRTAMRGALNLPKPTLG